jgi:hypothetical protein
MLLRWRRDEGLPLLRGRYTPHRHKSPALSTTFALTAWTLSRFSSDEHHLFRVRVPHGVSQEGSCSTAHAAAPPLTRREVWCDSARRLR